MPEVMFHCCNRCGKPKRSRRAKLHRLCFRCLLEESKLRDAERLTGAAVKQSK